MPSDDCTMAKTKRDRLHSVGSTQRDDVAKAVFKMKTNIGQHVLKNPGVAQAIVDKAELKQSDVWQSPNLASTGILTDWK